MSSYISVCVMVIFLTQHGRDRMDKNWKKRYNKIEFGKEELSGDGAVWKLPPFVSLFFADFYFF